MYDMLQTKKINHVFNLDILTTSAKEIFYCRYIALISLKTNSSFHFTLKDTYNMQYIEVLFFQ